MADISNYIRNCRDEFLRGVDIVGAKAYESYKNHPDLRESAQEYRNKHKARYGWLDAIFNFPGKLGENAYIRLQERGALDPRDGLVDIMQMSSEIFFNLTGTIIGTPLTAIKVLALGTSELMDIYFPIKEDNENKKVSTNNA